MEEHASSGSKGKFMDELLAESEKPLTLKDRLIGLVMIVVLFALAAGMFIRPVLFPEDTAAEITRHKTRKMVALVDLAWSRPVAVVLVLLALLMLWGTLTKKSAKANQPTQR